MTDHGPKPQPAGACKCGYPCIDYTPEWEMLPGAHYDPESESGDIPDRYYGDAVWTPVCYPVTPDRYTSRPYLEHVVRLAHAEGKYEAAEKIRQKYGIAWPDQEVSS